ncbi:MAG: YceI family protein [Pseudomonadota bacterium]
MKSILRSASAAALLSFAASAAADLSAVPSGDYGLDKTHGYITFSYSHLGFSNPHVGFDSFDVALDLNSDTPENSSLNVTIDAASINSRVAEFDDHLNGDKFFDTTNHPTITFTSTGIKKTGDDTFDVMGNLVIKGVSKPVTLAATINKAAQHPMRKVATVGVSASAKLNRSEWDLGLYAPAVGDEVTLMIEVELPQSK